MKFKDGVIVRIGPEIQRIFDVADQVHYEVTGQQALCTSGMEGNHIQESLHYRNLAVDLRIWYTDEVGETAYFATELQRRLGDNFDVLLETTHVHVEFDPED